MSDFKVGDCVTVKSGGPDMTVECIGSSKDSYGNGIDNVNCVWFSEITGIYMYESFNADCLKKQCK